jgi:hypothetical protein
MLVPSFAIFILNLGTSDGTVQSEQGEWTDLPSRPFLQIIDIILEKINPSGTTTKRRKLCLYLPYSG